VEGYVLAAGLALSACIAWAIGANDMANSVSIAVGSRVLRLRTAVLIFVASLTAGALLQGYMVMKTLGRGVVEDLDLVCAISSSAAAFTWITTATLLGLPISTTHSITSAVAGVGLARQLIRGYGSVNLGILTTIAFSWVTSPLSAMALAALSLRATASTRYLPATAYTRAARAVVVALTAFSAYSFGANDVANATGVYVATTSRYFGIPDAETMRYLALFSSVMIALGGLVLGRRVVVTLAYRITRLDVPSAIAAGFANAFTVWVFTTIPYLLIGYGLPISTTYAAAGSIMGVALVRSRSLSSIRTRSVITILLSWVATIPIAAGLGAVIYYLLAPTLGGTG
jgi:PiT family inorganic phosphate transporter